MTIKELIAKLDECRAALEDEFLPEAQEKRDAVEDDGSAESELLYTLSYVFEDALGYVESAISELEHELEHLK